MAGNQAGGQKTAVINKARYGKDFYRNIGAIGGKAKVPKGFALNIELARIVGAKGGAVSRRGKSSETNC